ncbi:hypothetical protein KZZ52_43525 [Dactylosporangium sp. AC04546]|uniref:hypothetical protein n=1 Tax=Dactylosporangium sp. AC04546 TaxID=2862460 RepID=UPI001EE0F022|nr:hypothetical protein [Dactylosporangium sp. AC04546]WVK80785.1 hypothetical protein KZZ52_43525 [Dactylosporangium sp. AC04546]
MSAGPVEDPSGYATSVLKDAIDYEGSQVAFIQLIAAMDREGEIVRDIRGKRTYRIDAGPAIDAAAVAPVTQAAPAVDAAVVPAGAGNVVIDYDRLARAVVREFWSFAMTQNVPPAPPAERNVETLKADRDRIAAERNDYAQRLEQARAKLDELLGGASVQHAATSDR